VQALTWIHAGAVAMLSSIAAALFGSAWFLRECVVAPLDSLRRSLAATEAGAFTQPIAGRERKDEIGAVARAAERLRQAVTGGVDNQGAIGLQRLIERLSKDVARIEADLARFSSAAAQARAGIEDASVTAAKASHAAIEAALLVREGVERMTLEAQANIAALTAVLGGRASGESPAPRNDADSPGNLGAPPELGDHLSGDTEAEAVLASLAGDLQALERFARDRKTIASESAAALTVALIEAIDRLNGVADRISATADLAAKNEAA
jgi:HAMP domain-containing protein